MTSPARMLLLLPTTLLGGYEPPFPVHNRGLFFVFISEKRMFPFPGREWRIRESVSEDGTSHIEEEVSETFHAPDLMKILMDGLDKAGSGEFSSAPLQLRWAVSEFWGLIIVRCLGVFVQVFCRWALPRGQRNSLYHSLPPTCESFP